MPRPAYEPTDEQRRQVEAFAAYGIRHEDICRLINIGGKPIDEKTLRKHFRSELDTGALKANARVAESLFVQAVGAPAQYDKDGKLLRGEQPRIVSAGIFWAKARMGWKETDGLELSGPNGAPIEVDDARSRLADLLARRTAGGRAGEAAQAPDAG